MALLDKTALNPFPDMETEYIEGFELNFASLLRDGSVNIQVDKTGAQTSIVKHDWAGNNVTLGRGFVQFAKTKHADIANIAVAAAVQTELFQLEVEKKGVYESPGKEYEAETLITSWVNMTRPTLEAYQTVLTGYGQLLKVSKPEFKQGIEAYLALLKFVIDNHARLQKSFGIKDVVAIDKVRESLSILETEKGLVGEIDVHSSIEALKTMAAA